MNKNDFIRFRAVIAGLAEVHQRELTATLLDAYWVALSEWPLAQFEHAAAHLLKTFKYMPKPADFEDLIRASDVTADEAWTLAFAACMSWRDPAVVTPGGRIDRAVHVVGGYRALAHANTEKELPHLARRFREAYDQLSDAEAVRDSMPELQSISAIGNRNRLRLAVGKL